MSLLNQKAPPPPANVRTVIKLWDEQPAYEQKRGMNRRMFTPEEVRAIRKDYARYERLRKAVWRYGGWENKRRRAKLRAYIFRRYGAEALARKYGGKPSTIRGIAWRLSYQEVD
jgi:hypothetical protein